MKIEYSELFLRDLKKLKSTTSYLAIKQFCFEELPKAESLAHVKHLKKIRGYISYYRIRIGDYRIGIKDEDDVILLMRVMHRKDIYRVFPNPK